MKTSLTQFEISVLRQIINVPGGTSTLDDLRCIKRADAVLKAAENDGPERPAAPGKDASDEDKKAYMEQVKAWTEQLKALAEQTAEVEFDQGALGVCKKRLKAFPGFFSDEKSRDRVLALADKLGVE
jgi:hypothetical protein